MDDEEFEKHMMRGIDALERIADALDQGLVIQNLQLEDQVTYTEMIRASVLINGVTDDTAPPTVGDVVDEPDPDPDHCSCGDPLCPDYDPEDDTFATGKECPNCGEGDISTWHSSTGQPDTFECNECHHQWPRPRIPQASHDQQVRENEDGP